jgi:Ser/Thr protein kinase RdoA (MazF antagonist)
VWLLLEDVPHVCSWPWRDVAACRAVLQSLAEFHAARLVIPLALKWNYESELQQSAVATLETLDAMRSSGEWSSLMKRAFRPLDRIATSLASRRAALLEFSPHDAVVLHGDMHPGNVILRRLHGKNRPVLFDWGRARAGSALEDVSSWLQSLGCWEPEARKRHDTLLRHYLSARGSPEALSSDLRAAYWMAGASNALAGALRYHCWRASTATTIHARTSAAHAAVSWLRVIIRADALSS